MDICDVYVEFLECYVHTILKARSIYPAIIFEQRIKYGISIWQCRHPDVNAYISRVLTNASSIIQSIKKLMIISRDASESVVDVITISCKFNNSNIREDRITLNQFRQLEDEFRSMLLRLSLLDTLMPVFASEGAPISFTLIYIKKITTICRMSLGYSA